MPLLRPTRQTSLPEFVALMALVSALDALSIDAMLPALQTIGGDFGIAAGNQPQLIISLFFLGMAVGQIFGGPISDTLGRKRAIFGFLLVYVLGCLAAIFSQSFGMILAARVLQGIGAAGPYVITLAMVRDRYEGEAMARINSFIMAVFILVPMVAPALGQAVMWLASWRAIFVAFLLLAVLAGMWLAVRQPETLAPEQRRPFSPGDLWAALKEVLGNRQALGYTIVGGFVFGAFMVYLSTVPQLFKDLYGIVDGFPLLFAALSFAIGLAGIVSGALVTRFGMRRLTALGLGGIGVSSLLCLVGSLLGGTPPLWLTLAYLATTLFCCGSLFGNLAALALEPLGHIAGMGASVYGGMSTLIGFPVGLLFGQLYDGSLQPLATGFAVMTVFSFAVMAWAEAARWRPAPTG